MHDVPYLNRNVGSEIISAFATIGTILKNQIKIPIGIQILAGANKEALSVAKAAALDFVRAEGFVFSHIADEGFMDGCAAELLRFRKQIEAEQIAIFTDIKKKHSSHAITSDITIADAAKSAEFFLSDGVIITGSTTGSEPNLSDLKKVKNSVQIPVLVGSGITARNLEQYWKFADGFIVGSYFKEGGFWENEISLERVGKLMKQVQRLNDF